MAEDDVTIALSKTVTEREKSQYPQRGPSKVSIQKPEQVVYIARFKTGYIAAQYCDELVVSLSPEEYEDLSQLPENTVMRVGIKQRSTRKEFFERRAS